MLCHAHNPCSHYLEFSFGNPFFLLEFFKFQRSPSGWAWWFIPVIPPPRRWKQEDQEFKASLGYIASLRPV
jgi:hypothetical protein